MKRKLLIGFLILILLYAAGGLFFHYYKKPTASPKPKPISEINNYNYTLHSGATKLMKDEFAILKKNLDREDIDEAQYAESVAKLFIIDLYTISNKLNKYDVGGTQYVLPLSVANYKLNVKDTIYKYVEDNTDGKRTQILPEVKTIVVAQSSEITEIIDEKSYQGYKISLTWTYEQDLGYDTESDITVVKDEKYYYVSAKN